MGSVGSWGRGPGRAGRGGRGGFSLIELLIVVAIIAALVGVAVPFFQDNLAESQRAKALEDLAIIQKAVLMYENRVGKLLLGTRLDPLLGRYLQELPKDPWGNPYLYDGGAGFLGSYGADATPGGTGGDTDIVPGAMVVNGKMHLVKPIIPRRIQYRGPWGPPTVPVDGGGTPILSKPTEGNSFIITFTRSVVEYMPTNLPSQCLYMVPVGSTFTSVQMSNDVSWPGGTWASAAQWFMPVVDPLHDPKGGVLVLRCTKDTIRAVGGPYAAIRPDARIDFGDDDDLFFAPGPCKTTWTPDAQPASPLDPAIYGAGALEYLPHVYGPPGDPAGPGLRLERY